MLKGLTSDLLGRACHIFLTLAYPEGESSIPPSKAALLDLPADQPLERFLGLPMCQRLTDGKGGLRGYAFRLGSACFPHVKLQVTHCDYEDGPVFGVDTHDGISLDPGHPDAACWAALQAANRTLKERIERAWEAEGLLTFNSLLRQGLKRAAGPGGAVGSNTELSLPR